jgi:1-acyl-sn-glycerol-3-phosphate acyltransferase
VETLLKRGKFLGLAPEAAIHPKKKFYLGKPGFAWFASKTRSPVIPVGIMGTRIVTPKGTFAVGIAPPPGRKITVVFGNPVIFNGNVEESDVVDFRDCLMHRVRQLSNWEGVPKLLKEKLIDHYQEHEKKKERVVRELFVSP